jgi:hypothetical protein
MQPTEMNVNKIINNFVKNVFWPEESRPKDSGLLPEECHRHPCVALFAQPCAAVGSAPGVPPPFARSIAHGLPQRRFQGSPWLLADDEPAEQEDFT